jgi:predicted transcriptional regulator
MAQITQIITIHEYNKMTAEQKAALSGDNRLAVVQQDWEEARINAAIAAMPIVADDGYNVRNEQHLIAKYAVELADALIEEIKHSDDVYAECRRMDAINTASVCENMTKIQKELQKKGGQDETDKRTS